MASDAIGLERVSRIVGYSLKKGNFSNVTPNLPQRIAIIGEANEANQLTLSTDAWEATTAQATGERYGFGSPLYQAMRILRPSSSAGVGGIPIVIYPQAKALGAQAKEIEIEASGTATSNGTHTIVLNGRNGLEGTFYDINIEIGDGPAEIHQKIEDAISAVLGAPCLASSSGYEVTLQAKWRGLTSNELNASVNTNGNALGITYAISTTQAGSGTPSISAALDAFGSEWNTLVLNTYGLQSNIMTALEAFNGVPDPASGRYSGATWKPFIAVSGSTLEDPSAVTDTRKSQVTIAVAPAPLSLGFSFEAAANAVARYARIAQDTPHLDLGGQAYPDMPTPLSIGIMADQNERDRIVKSGCSTVNLVNGAYQVQDFVTTYHPDGETPPQFRFVRNLIVDFNVRFAYFLQEQRFVVDHVIANDGDVVTATKVVKPSSWKQVVDALADELAAKALIADPAFMQESIEVNISTTNPDRFETFFRYKRTGVARIAATTAEAGFNFGSLG
jgi:phage tail sheath gpL-like